MAGKKNLDDMLAEETPRPPIRRGQGIRLSTDPAPQAQAPAAEPTPPRDGAPAHMPESAQAHKLESAQTHRRADAQATSSERGNSRSDDQVRNVPERVTRVSQGQRLRVDLVKQLKRIAVEEDRKLYEVMEEAIEQYLDRRKATGR